MKSSFNLYNYICIGYLGYHGIFFYASSRESGENHQDNILRTNLSITFCLYFIKISHGDIS